MSKFLTLLCFLLLPAGAFAQENTPFTMEAENIEYNASSNTVVASGKVEIVGDEGAVWADKIVYDQQTRELTARGDVTFVDPNGFAIFIDEMKLDGKMRFATLKAIKARLGNEGPAMVAGEASRYSDGRIEMHNASYTACKPCNEKGDLFAWQVHAKEISYDPSKSRISYKDAVFDFYDVPLLYLPYFRHPVGKQEAQNGFLAPSFGRSTARGEEVTASYYWRHNDYHDTTLRTRLMTRRGVQMMLEDRHIYANSASEFKASLIEDQKSSSTRSHVEGAYEYTFTPGNRAGLNGTLTSDDTYLDDFFDRTPSFLPTTAYYEKASKKNYLAVFATHFRELRADKDPANSAHPLPRIQYERLLWQGEEGAQWLFKSDFLTLHRSEGTRTRRLVALSDYTKQMQLNDGHIITAEASIRGDVYHVDNGPGRDGFHGRIHPEIAATWEQPFISPGGSHKITPKAMAIISPRGGNPSGIPNDDSVAYELDTSNLFSTNRFAGFDRLEAGPRIVYGLDNHWGTATVQRWRLFFGQSYRFFDDNTLPTGGGTGTKFSDWVGYVAMSPAPWFSLNTRFRLDNADFEARRLDSSMVVGDPLNNHVQLSYTFLDNGPEEASLKMQYEIMDNVVLASRFRRDLRDNGKLLTSEGSIEYTSDCYRASFTARRRGFDNRNVNPSTDFLLNFELLTTGRTLD